MGEIHPVPALMMHSMEAKLLFRPWSVVSKSIVQKIVYKYNEYIKCLMWMYSEVYLKKQCVQIIGGYNLNMQSANIYIQTKC